MKWKMHSAVHMLGAEKGGYDKTEKCPKLPMKATQKMQMLCVPSSCAPEHTGWPSPPHVLGVLAGAVVLAPPVGGVAAGSEGGRQGTHTPPSPM